MFFYFEIFCLIYSKNAPKKLEIMQLRIQEDPGTKRKTRILIFLRSFKPD